MAHLPVGAILLLAGLVYLAAPLLAWSWNRQPFLGAFLEPTLVFNNVRVVAWSREGPVPPWQDRLIALDGEPLSGPRSLTPLLRRYQPGDEVTLTLQRPDGTVYEQQVTLRAFRLRDFVHYFFIPYLIGGAYLALGLWVYAARWFEPSGRAFALFSGAAALVLGGLFDLYTTHWLVPLWSVGLGLIGAALIDLALLFPRPIRFIRRRPRLHLLAYLPAPFLIGAALVTASDFTHPWRYGPVWQLCFAYTALGALLLLAMMLYRLRNPDPFIRHQARIILWGLILAFVPLALWLVPAAMGHGALFQPGLHLIPLIFLPLAIAHTIVRYRLLDVDRMVRQGVSYLILTALVAGGYLLTLNLASIVLGEALEADNPIAVAALVVVLALILDPARSRLQRSVDRIFYRDRLDYRQELEAFSHALTTRVNLAGVLEALQERIEAAFHPNGLSIFLWNERAQQYLPVGQEHTVAFTPESPLVRYLLHERRTLCLLPDRDLPAELAAEKERLESLGAMVFVPLGQHGWLALGIRRSGEPYTTDDLAYLEAIAGQAALAIDRVRLITKLEQRVEELEVLRIIGQTIGFKVEIDDLLELVYAQTSRLLDTTNYAIVLYDEEKQRFSYAFYVINGEREYPDDEWPLGEGLSSEIIRTGRPILTDNYVAECERRGVTPRHRDGGQRSWMGVPLHADDRVLGVMRVFSHDPNVVYTQEQLQILSSIADQAALILHRSRLYQEMEKRARQLATLNEVSQTITSTLDLKSVLHLIMEKAVEILDAEAGSLLLVDDETGELVFHVTLGPAAEDLEGVRLPPGTGIVGAVARTGEPIIVQDAHQDERWFAGTDQKTAFVTRAILAVPLQAKGRTIGVIELINKLDGTPFDEEDSQLLTAFASNAAVAIENARLFGQTDQALQARVAELSMMQRIDRELNATLDFARVMELTLDWAIRMTGAQAGTVQVLDEEREVLLPAASQGYPEDQVEELQQHPWPADRGVIGRVLRTGEPALVPDVQQDPDYVAVLPEIRAELAVPIRREEKVIGVINLESPTVGAFSQEDLEFVTRLADHAAIAIENARLYEQVKRANEAKSQFVSIVAHEMKIPMTSIKGYARLLELGMGGAGLDETQKGFLKTIIANVDRMNKLVTDLLDISRIETGRLRLEIEAVPIVSVIEETLNSTRSQIEEKGLKLHVEVPDDLPLVRGDRTRLVQVLTNLVSNAYKYTKEGSITIRAERCQVSENGQVREYVRCSVTDTGIGIAPQDLKRLFKVQFVRFENAVDMAPGHGLGLWLVNQLVRLQGGEMSVESELGKGSTFAFTVPVAKQGNGHQPPS